MPTSPGFKRKHTAERGASAEETVMSWCPVLCQPRAVSLPPYPFWNPRRSHTLSVSTPLQPRLPLTSAIPSRPGLWQAFPRCRKGKCTHLRHSLRKQKPNVPNFAASVSHLLKSQGGHTTSRECLPVCPVAPCLKFCYYYCCYYFFLTAETGCSDLRFPECFVCVLL